MSQSFIFVLKCDFPGCSATKNIDPGSIGVHGLKYLCDDARRNEFVKAQGWTPHEVENRDYCELHKATPTTVPKGS